MSVHEREPECDVAVGHEAGRIRVEVEIQTKIRIRRKGSQDDDGGD